MSFLKKIKIFIFFLFSAFFLFASCVDERIVEPEEEPGINNPLGSLKGDGIAFTVSLPSMQSSTRAVNYPGSELDETYEDYVDPERLCVFFLEEDGCILKILKTWGNDNTKAFSLIPIEDFENRDYKNYYFRLSFTELEEENNNGAALAAYLRKNPFKIAVLANVETSRLTNNFANIREATLNSDGSLVNKGDHINILHHQTDSSDPYGGDKANVYKFLYENNPNNKYNKVLGYYSDWVRNLSTEIKDEGSARNFIRKYWNPDGSFRLDDYSDLWQLWNFGGTANDNAYPYSMTFEDDNNNSFAKKWETRNGNFLRSKITETGDGNSISDFTTKGCHPTETTPLTFVSIENAKAIYSNRYYGIKLPVIEKMGTNRLDPNNNAQKGYFHFTAHATGTLFITGKHGNDDPNSSKNEREVKLLAQKGYSTSIETLSFKYRDSKTNQVNGVQTVSKKISITGNEEEIYIYNWIEEDRGNTIEIYQIEYVEDKYLYDTNRIGVKPEVLPIPMYGVQSYPALNNFWEEGTIFDLTNFNKLTDDSFMQHASVVPLLRSVAKVEVRIPTSLRIDRNHVYLRSSNRKGRWEPLNVVTDTYEIWKDHIMDDVNGSHSRECEWFSIRYHNPFYEGSGNSNSASGQVEDYKKKLAWYYGDWVTAGGWVTTGDGVTAGDGETNETANLKTYVPGVDDCSSDESGLRGWGHSVYHSNDNNNPGYPRVMNAVIDRSDFCKFIYAGVDGIYDRYVLYTGEKYVDDPNDVGPNENMLSCDPKVCHIEFRTQDDPKFNVDDNNCYRIYFIENGFNKSMQIPNLSNNSHTWEEMYEQSRTNLQQHWPIMRDHYYSFTVLDIEQRIAIVKLEVLPWRKVKDISVTW